LKQRRYAHDIVDRRPARAYRAVRSSRYSSTPSRGFAMRVCAIVPRAMLAVALLLSVAVAAAQETYPSRPITLIVPFPPGGVADIVGRPFADALSRELKTPVVIENKPGAGGGIGMGAVAKAKPDGYTLLLALSSISILPEADKVLGRAPLYRLDQFTPIARLTADPTVLAVRADSRWKTLQDFVADARKRPGAITYGSSGNYGTMHMPMEMFAHTADIKLLHVPFTGGGPAVIALLGGQVDALSTGPSTVLQHVKAGKVRVLASWGDHRLASLPEVRTLEESGYNAVFFQWSGLFAPAGTPDAVVARLRAAARVAAADARFVATLQTVETPVAYLDAPELRRFWDADAKKLAEAVQRVGKIE
jgi:tripartite-type tricarboxylate transporter receptor subunit TctC